MSVRSAVPPGVRSAVKRLLRWGEQPVVVEPFDGSRTVKVGNGTYTLQSTDRDGYLKDITGEFEPEMWGVFQDVVKPGGVAIDVGANLGFTAILLRQLSSRVIAYEISPSTFGWLEQNIEQSGLDGIELVPVGLGEVAGPVELTHAEAFPAGSFIADHDTADRRYHVTQQAQTRTLDDEVARLGLAAVDFVKIDVEGFELSVLKGGADTLAKFKPVVVLEMNPWCLNAFQRIALPDFIDYVLSVFPLAYSFQGEEYFDLRAPDRRYLAMHKCIVENVFWNVVVAFEPAQLAAFCERRTAL